MRKNIIVIPPCFAYGDCLSVIGMVYYFLNHYEKVHFCVGINNNALLDNYNHYFLSDPLFNNRIYVTTQPEELINNGSYGEYDVCNTLTGNWQGANYTLADLPNIDKDYYFNDLNPVYNKLDILDEHKCSPNTHIPNNTFAINHEFYYNLVGLSNNVRMDYFNYVRNNLVETELKNLVLERHGLKEGDKYNIINDPTGQWIGLKSNIKNSHPIINLNYLSPTFGYMLKLVEGAETINFIEGCNVNFFYHCQYKNIFNYNKEISFHVWIRNRIWDGENMKLDYAWKMMTTPQMTNWRFILNQSEI